MSFTYFKSTAILRSETPCRHDLLALPFPSHRRRYRRDCREPSRLGIRGPPDRIGGRLGGAVRLVAHGNVRRAVPSGAAPAPRRGTQTLSAPGAGFPAALRNLRAAAVRPCTLRVRVGVPSNSAARATCTNPQPPTASSGWRNRGRRELEVAPLNLLTLDSSFRARRFSCRTSQRLEVAPHPGWTERADWTSSA
jgi:hypothetical protein